MKTRNAVGPDRIPVKKWKYMGEAGLNSLNKLFNVILRTIKMPEECKFSILSLYVETKVILKITTTIEVSSYYVTL